jgi:hypothetical protein
MDLPGGWPRRGRWRVRVRLLLSALLAAATFWFLLKRLDVAAVWTETREMTWPELLTVAAVAAWNLVTTPAAWRPRPLGRGGTPLPPFAVAGRC